jgi:hypothetical protein
MKPLCSISGGDQQAGLLCASHDGPTFTPGRGVSASGIEAARHPLHSLDLICAAAVLAAAKEAIRAFQRGLISLAPRT